MSEIKGGAKLEKYLRDTAKKVSNPGTLRVGFFKGATYPDGTPVAVVAAANNFGAPSRGIPPRPFFTNMVNEKSPEWPDTLASILPQVNFDATKALNLMGEGIKGQLKQSIIDTNEPPLATATVKRKGHSKPLIDTSHLINSVAFEVVDSNGNSD